jgi:hypothetical protein
MLRQARAFFREIVKKEEETAIHEGHYKYLSKNSMVFS